MGRKLQSAMEYLMTYGWAILVIAIVVGVLYYIGIFTPHGIGNGCIPVAGFLCQNPVLSSNGLLSFGFSQTNGYPITVTGIECTLNNSLPASFQAEGFTLQSGDEAPISIYCPLQSSAIGQQFTGYIWIQYSTQTRSGQATRFASVSLQTSVIGSGGQPGTTTAGSSTTSTSTSTTTAPTIHYVPITITNNQGSPTPSPFQQMITVPSSSYSSYINSQWSNVEFTTGPAATGSTLGAWVESNPSNSGSTAVWVNLPGGIGANSNTVIYMDFMTSNVMSASGPTGEAPQLSASYAQYDDGASVFPVLYQNFMGTSTPSGWQIAGGYGSPVIDNGIQSTLTGNYIALLTTGSYGLNPNQILDYYVNLPSLSTSYGMAFGYITSAGNTGSGVHPYEGMGAGSVIATHDWNFISGTNSNFAYDANNLATGTWNVYSDYWPSSSTNIAFINYAQTYTFTNPPSPIYNAQIQVGIAGNNGGQYAPNMQWIRIRAYPPSGTMPSTSFGPLV